MCNWALLPWMQWTVFEHVWSFGIKPTDFTAWAWAKSWNFSGWKNLGFKSPAFSFSSSARIKVWNCLRVNRLITGVQSSLATSPRVTAHIVRFSPSSPAVCSAWRSFPFIFAMSFNDFVYICMSNCCFSEANSSLIGLTRAVNSKTRKVTSAGSPTKRTVRCSRALPSVGRRSWVLRPEGTPTTWTFPPRLLIDFPCFVFGSLPLIVFYGWITVNLNCWRIFLDVHFPASL